MAGFPKPPLRRRRILERPRLIRALDRSHAQVRMLVAGPGYGKTTLAEQWAAQGRRVAWIRARRSSADVAVLARQMAAAGAEVLPGCDRRLCERLNVTQDPADELDVLVDLLSEDLAPWPDDAWIVIDDYQHIRESETAEALVETVIAQSPLQVLISTRDRPSWVSTRSVLYGDVLEIGQSLLAMSEEEVHDLLAGAHDGMSSGLLALAGGWPAVIALASLTTSESTLPDAGLEVPEQLYEFFAEEVYKGLEPESRTGLGLLATAPSLDRELAAELLGPERADRVCAEALTLGVLEERGGRLELHPLAAAFLEERARRETTSDLGDTLARCLAAYRRRREWDAAFDLLDRFGTPAEFESVFSEALESLLNEARLATLETWISSADVKQLTSPIFELAKAEIALREGKHLSAQTFAQTAIAMAGNEKADAYRASMVAGRAAHSGSREESALEFYRLAESVADTRRGTRDALWGQLMCASALELSEAKELLEILELPPNESDHYELVRMADKKLGMDFRGGAVRSLANARLVAELVGHLPDPFARCSFRCAFAYALNLGAHYQEAHEQATFLLEESSEFRVDPALPYAHLLLATSLAGMRFHEEAHEALDAAVRESRRCNDEFGNQSVYASRLRLLVQEGRSKEASSMEPPELDNALRSVKGEVLASRGLALASLGRFREARSLGDSAIRATAGIEARVLVAAIDAVCSVKERTTEMVTAGEELVSIAFEAGAVDLAVTAYRGNAELLVALLSSPTARERTMFAIARAGDESLVGPAGYEPIAFSDPVETLSHREREVHALVCEGFSNKEIAKRLFITEGTVKAHLQNVYDKLGVRSRTAVAINAARNRSRQATSSIRRGEATSKTDVSPTPRTSSAS